MNGCILVGSPTGWQMYTRACAQPRVGLLCQTVPPLDAPMIMLMVIEVEWGGSVLPTATSLVPAAVRGEWGRWVGGCIWMGEAAHQQQKQQQPPPPPPVCRRCCSTCAGGCTQSPTTEETKPLQSPTIPPASCIRAGWVSATAITNGCSSRVQRHLAVPAAT